MFYTDRLTGAIVEAMECASSAGALVFFEPSDIGDVELFERALGSTTILKYSVERLGETFPAKPLNGRHVSIVTHGAAGLKVVQGARSVFGPSVEAPTVRDTCGSGDMVSVGVIDVLVSRRGGDAGARAGQRLAAVNCAFAGARGVFEKFGASAARTILDEREQVQIELFPDP